jgi:hypothetical protein
MEHHQYILKDALSKLPSFQPADRIWTEIDRKLGEEPLQNALRNLPTQQPGEFVWEMIENKMAGTKNRHLNWWYAAAMIFTIGFAGFWYNYHSYDSSISYSQELIDARLQAKQAPVTDQEYEKLVSYCEAETVVCNTTNFRRLKQEYETLRSATQKLQKAMGNYNTAPELTRQFSAVEQEKAEVLNEMAKMI